MMLNGQPPQKEGPAEARPSWQSSSPATDRSSAVLNPPTMWVDVYDLPGRGEPIRTIPKPLSGGLPTWPCASRPPESG